MEPYWCGNLFLTGKNIFNDGPYALLTGTDDLTEFRDVCITTCKGSHQTDKNISLLESYPGWKSSYRPLIEFSTSSVQLFSQLRGHNQKYFIGLTWPNLLNGRI
jgi:hypothetical protein